MMYMIFIIDHIHYLMNESKMLIFTYNSNRRVYHLLINEYLLYYCEINTCKLS